MALYRRPEGNEDLLASVLGKKACIRPSLSRPSQQEASCPHLMLITHRPWLGATYADIANLEKSTADIVPLPATLGICSRLVLIPTMEF